MNASVLILFIAGMMCAFMVADVMYATVQEKVEEVENLIPVANSAHYNSYFQILTGNVTIINETMEE